jgi:D-alanyl-lipoteichoic acid acyltransferase DltB (MBOAT superfamily)
MLFNSVQFPLFFAAFFCVFWVLPSGVRHAWVLCAGVYFYGAAAANYLWVLFFLIGSDFYIGKKLARCTSVSWRRGLLFLGILANFSLLAIFKWLYERTNLFFPPGLSFHTFQSVAYLMEVYHRRFPVERSVWVYSEYILFWPQLMAGPIERPQGLLRQLHAGYAVNAVQVSEGLQLVLLGFIKKIVIADRLGLLTGQVFQNLEHFGGGPLWFTLVALTFEYYGDFSGYTDIARGCAKLMGKELGENFKQPLLASSPQEFWRRWHLSLTHWFRDYVYFPLLGHRPSPLRQVLSIFGVFSLIGLWHGLRPSMVAWGLYQAFVLVLSRYVRFFRLGLFSIPLTILAVAGGFGFFKSASISSAWHFYSRLFSSSCPTLQEGSAVGWSHGTVSAALAVIFLSLVIDAVCRYHPALWKKSPRVFRLALCNLAFVLLLFCGVFEQRAFVYFQF